MSYLLDIAKGLVDPKIVTEAMYNRRAKAIKMLAASPEKQKAVHVDSDSDPDNLIITFGVRHVHTFELKVPKNRCDAFKLMELLGRNQGYGYG